MKPHEDLYIAILAIGKASIKEHTQLSLIEVMQSLNEKGYKVTENNYALKTFYEASFLIDKDYKNHLRYWFSPDAYFKYHQHEALEQAKHAARNASWYAFIAIGISILFALFN